MRKIIAGSVAAVLCAILCYNTVRVVKIEDYVAEEPKAAAKETKTDAPAKEQKADAKKQKSKPEEEVVKYKSLPQWLLVQMAGAFALAALAIEFGRKWRKMKPNGGRGCIGDIFTKINIKYPGILLPEVEKEDGASLLAKLEALRKSDSEVPFSGEKDIEQGYALAYAALASGTLDTEQMARLDQLGSELNFSQKRLLFFPTYTGKALESYIIWILLSFIVGIYFACVQMTVPDEAKLGLECNILLYGVFLWATFMTPLYMLEKIYCSWFFELYRWMLNLIGLSAASAFRTLVTEEGVTVTIWIDKRDNRVVATEKDYSITFFLFAFKIAFAITVFVVIVTILLPILSVVHVVSNFISHQ